MPLMPPGAIEGFAAQAEAADDDHLRAPLRVCSTPQRRVGRRPPSMPYPAPCAHRASNAADTIERFLAKRDDQRRLGLDELAVQ